MKVAVVSHRSSATNLALSTRRWEGVQPELLSPPQALLRLGSGDLALARLDVRDDLDGIEEGLWALERLADCGVTVLNRAPSLLRAHDKLLTARTLRRAGLPHPRTTLLDPDRPLPELEFPAVLKPRFGSWGVDVLLCTGPVELEQAVVSLASRPWFRRSGLLAQELIPPLGHDLRLIVARGVVVGAAKRVAAPGEWRTNVALGASVVSVAPPPVAVRLAQEAAAASGLDLVGVDLLPTGPGGYCVLELNGAVEFRQAYSFPGRDVFADAIAALAGSRTTAVDEAVAATSTP
jgi:RimK family alpha-L-glutamate ligase